VLARLWKGVRGLVGRKSRAVMDRRVCGRGMRERVRGVAAADEVVGWEDSSMSEGCDGVDGGVARAVSLLVHLRMEEEREASRFAVGDGCCGEVLEVDVLRTMRRAVVASALVQLQLVLFQAL